MNTQENVHPTAIKLLKRTSLTGKDEGNVEKKKQVLQF